MNVCFGSFAGLRRADLRGSNRPKADVWACGKLDPMTNEIDKMFARARELQEEGKAFSEATSIAELEHRIKKWLSPTKKFDGYLHVVVSG